MIFYSEIGERKKGEFKSEGTADFFFKKLTEHLTFGNVPEDMLWNRCVCEMGDITIQSKLLAEGNLIWNKNIQTATAMKTAVKNAQDVQLKKDILRELIKKWKTTYLKFRAMILNSFIIMDH